MTRASNLSSTRPTIWSLVVTLVAFPALTCADKPTQTISEPGFRPDSQYAADFLDATGHMRIAVLPTIIRRVERTAHSFASQQQIVDYLNESGLASAVTAPQRIDPGPLRRHSQWEIFQYGELSFSEALSPSDAIDYTFAMEILVPGDQAVFGIEVYILDQHGRSAFSFLLNAHHEMFSKANLVSRNTSEEARNKMINNATGIGLAALSAQIEQTRDTHSESAVGRPLPAEDTARHYSESAIDESSSRITLDPKEYEGLASEKAMTLTCECAELATSRGFRYFRIDERAELPDGQRSFRLTFYNSPPEGMPVAEAPLDPDQTLSPDLMTAALDAAEYMTVCEMLTTE